MTGKKKFATWSRITVLLLTVNKKTDFFIQKRLKKVKAYNRWSVRNAH